MKYAFHNEECTARIPHSILNSIINHIWNTKWVSLVQTRIFIPFVLTFDLEWKVKHKIGYLWTERKLRHSNTTAQINCSFHPTLPLIFYILISSILLAQWSWFKLAIKKAFTVSYKGNIPITFCLYVTCSMTLFSLTQFDNNYDLISNSN